LVHRDLLVPDGPILRATRAPEEQTREFLASRDNAFRPVGLELGPDGALYLLDMHRDVIEHPDYIPKKLLEKQDVRAGDNLGRIYRLAPRGWPTRRDLPGGMAPDELVGLLSSPNQWTRLTAQRLLVAQRATNTVTALRQVATSAFEPLGRLHALWTLEGLGALDRDTLAAALDDPIAYLRVNGLALARLGLLQTPKIALRAESLLADPHPEVRFLAALTAGDHDWVRVSDLVPVLERDVAFPWSRRAVLSSLGSRVHLLGLGIHGEQP
ncbi:MAG: dehydrogenase, partial [Verrucomicrobiae bacterium]|nr:dehydrogenase [Verrucomicrobiae bacterium]